MHILSIEENVWSKCIDILKKEELIHDLASFCNLHPFGNKAAANLCPSIPYQWFTLAYVWLGPTERFMRRHLEIDSVLYFQDISCIKDCMSPELSCQSAMFVQAIFNNMQICIWPFHSASACWVDDEDLIPLSVINSFAWNCFCRKILASIISMKAA